MRLLADQLVERLGAARLMRQRELFRDGLFDSPRSDERPTVAAIRRLENMSRAADHNTRLIGVVTYSCNPSANLMTTTEPPAAHEEVARPRRVRIASHFSQYDVHAHQSSTAKSGQPIIFEKFWRIKSLQPLWV
ncbi:MAG: hypothetical protein R3A47_02940 [Polyangiales bacterium]